MSAAVATRQSQGPSNPTSRLGSPLDTKRHFDEPKRASPQVSNKDLVKQSPKSAFKPSPVRAATARAAEKASNSTTKPSTASSTTTANPTANNTSSTAESSPQKKRAPSLPPPPLPPATVEDAGDYFSAVHASKYGEEPNPFEQSFSVPEGLTPGKALLPPASQIASPSVNLGTGNTYNWGFNSLRSGPLSPAMLAGPSGHPFDSSLRTGLTPNESGIRSGLTPGGGGSMFPAPSPNTQALFGFGSGTTPGTMEFHKTAMAAQAANRAANKPVMPQKLAIPKSEEGVDGINGGLTVPKAAPIQRQGSDPFGVDANAAASGLYMLAQQGHQHQNENQFVPANIPQVIQVTQPTPTPMSIDTNGNNMERASIATSGHSRNTSSSIARGVSEGSDEGMGSDNDVNINGRGKKAKAGIKKNAMVTPTSAKIAGNRRKAEELKGPAKKKSKASIASSLGDDDDDMMMDDDMMDDDMGMDDGPLDNKKMTDEEKRKNFLERNRVAALKCRQRKKQWLANLQAKVEYYGAENDALTAQVTNLREEILTLKTLLLAHKDCPISRSAGAQGMGGLDALGLSAQDYGQVHHGYAVQQVSMAPPGPRRFS